MTSLGKADELFFNRSDLTSEGCTGALERALKGADDGELFLEYSVSESFSFDDGRLRSASSDTSQGFGLRAIADEATAYAHGSELSDAALNRAADTVSSVTRGHDGTFQAAPPGTNRLLYEDINPLSEVEFSAKTKLLADIDQYLRDKDDRVRQVMTSLLGEWRVVEIIRPGGARVADIRPLVRLNIAVVAGDGDVQETGSHGTGGRTGYTAFIAPDAWQASADEALRQALVKLEAVPAPAGEMEVVLGPGWPGILLHEAVGHGLEGDFNRKKTSVFSGLMGERVASPGVTVIDDGTIEGRRGSLTVDDEGTPSSATTLIEDGILVGFMQDRMNARLMGVEPTGNGRRQDFAHKPMPRMTNTYMLAGDTPHEEILGSVKKGLYAVNFGGGQVDITSGKFVFSASEAYMIENGKIGPAVKGATLIGNGADALTRITMVGDDMALDPGIGTCGKDGQGVPVGVGQPTLKMSALTVGGTAAG
ncbi:MAG TPA: metalloprotease TldD [Alphaproteobacteria bacterium]|nr:metalloprotease TldD [Alphaproteobacteria bacterium]